MKKVIISTLAAFTSSMCLGFAAQGEPEIPEKVNTIIEQGTPDDETPSIPPVLEKCKKKKK